MQVSSDARMQETRFAVWFMVLIAVPALFGASVE